MLFSWLQYFHLTTPREVLQLPRQCAGLSVHDRRVHWGEKHWTLLAPVPWVLFSFWRIVPEFFHLFGHCRKTAELSAFMWSGAGPKDKEGDCQPEREQHSWFKAKKAECKNVCAVRSNIRIKILTRKWEEGEAEDWEKKKGRCFN